MSGKISLFIVLNWAVMTTVADAKEKLTEPVDTVILNAPEVNIANTPDVNVLNVPNFVIVNKISEPIPVKTACAYFRTSTELLI